MMMFDDVLKILSIMYLILRRSAEREVVGSNHGRTNTQNGF